MITDCEKWHYLAVKRLSALYREVTGNNHGDFHFKLFSVIHYRK